MRCKALSVVEPAGDWICSGKKTLEIRRWAPEKWPMTDLLIVQNKIRLSRNGQKEDPNGVGLALVDVIGVGDWQEEDLLAACGQYYEKGWLAWKLSNIRPFLTPQRLPAKLGIYEVDLIEP